MKRATATALWALEKTGISVPLVGSVFVVKNWNGAAVCIVKTTKVTILPFREITEAHARREGEGDHSLAYWRRVHTRFYRDELKNLELELDEAMPIVFEEFEKVFP